MSRKGRVEGDETRDGYDVFQELGEMQKKVSEIKSVSAGAKECVRASTGCEKGREDSATECHRCVCFSLSTRLLW